MQIKLNFWYLSRDRHIGIEFQCWNKGWFKCIRLVPSPPVEVTAGAEVMWCSSCLMTLWRFYFRVQGSVSFIDGCNYIADLPSTGHVRRKLEIIYHWSGTVWCRSMVYIPCEVINVSPTGRVCYMTWDYASLKRPKQHLERSSLIFEHAREVRKCDITYAQSRSA